MPKGLLGWGAGGWGWGLGMERGSSVRTHVAQPSISSTTPSSLTFEHLKALEKDNHFTRHQAESLPTIFPTMKDVTSKDDIRGLSE